MGELTKREYWDLIYSIYEDAKLEDQNNSSKGTIKSLLTRILGEKIKDYMGDYAMYRFWKIYMKYLPKKEGAKILEVGSAPGYLLVKLAKIFKFIPYGVEYSDSGVELNKRVFLSNNLNPNNVIYADVLSEKFQKQFKDFFNIVISNGFIEHFTNVEDVIEKHINLLTKGGALAISIPNFRGLNYFLQRFFYKEDIQRHNIKIMRKEIFSRLFDNRTLSPLFCDYFGTFSFILFNTSKTSFKSFLLTFCLRLQLILNILFRIAFQHNGAESRSFSPYLIFIGVKKE